MNQPKLIVHVSEIDISQSGGMGRVESYWKTAFENAGYLFYHIGPREVGKLRHKSLFSLAAYQYFLKRKIKAHAFIVHEPAALFFTRINTPLFIESHGIERRNWEKELINNHGGIRLLTRITFPIWRLFSCDQGMKKAHKLLLINNEDRTFALVKYKRKEEDIFVFRNGVIPSPLIRDTPENFTVLFNGSWIARKGNKDLVKAAYALWQNGLNVHYLLIGTGKSSQQVLQDWPEPLQGCVEVISHFRQDQEAALLGRASVVVLPSHFEGQPLSILQAMAVGKCCITTNCCGQKDFIENNVTGFLFEPSDSGRLASLIERCVRNPELADNVGLAAKKAMQDRSWQKVSSELVEYVTDNIP